MQTCELTNRNCIEGLACGASRHMTTKPFGTVGKVNAAVVHGKTMFLLGEICFTCSAKLQTKPVRPHWTPKEPNVPEAVIRHD